jgi:hypothetical protein
VLYCNQEVLHAAVLPDTFSLARERRITAVLDFWPGALLEARRPEDLRIDSMIPRPGQAGKPALG